MGFGSCIFKKRITFLFRIVILSHWRKIGRIMKNWKRQNRRRVIAEGMCNFIVIIKLFIYGKTNYKWRLLGFLILLCGCLFLYIISIHTLA